MGDGQAPDVTVFLQNVQGSPVGERRDGEIGQALQFRFVLERSGQDLGHLRDEFRLALHSLRFGLCTFPIGDVAHNLRCADDDPGCIPDR